MSEMHSTYSQTSNPRSELLKELWTKTVLSYKQTDRFKEESINKMVWASSDILKEIPVERLAECFSWDFQNRETRFFPTDKDILNAWKALSHQGVSSDHWTRIVHSAMERRLERPQDFTEQQVAGAEAIRSGMQKDLRPHLPEQKPITRDEIDDISARYPEFKELFDEIDPDSDEDPDPDWVNEFYQRYMRVVGNLAKKMTI